MPPPPSLQESGPPPFQELPSSSCLAPRNQLEGERSTEKGILWCEVMEEEEREEGQRPGNLGAGRGDVKEVRARYGARSRKAGVSWPPASAGGVH